NNAPAHKSLLNKGGDPLYEVDWDDPAFTVWEDPRGDKPADWTDADVYLERSIPGILAGSWVIFERLGTNHAFFRVNSNAEASLGAFGMSGKASALMLNSKSGQAIDSTDKSGIYLLRKTTAYVQSEKLTLSDAPDPGPLNAQSTQITLQGVIPYLKV